MQLGEKKLIVQRASVGAKGGLPPEVIRCYYSNMRVMLFATGTD